MQFRALLLSTLLVAGTALRVDFADKEWKERPVNKVVNLLKDMQNQLQKEEEQDAELYDAMVCWCETNDKEKTKAIELNTHKTGELEASINEGAAAVAKLTVEIEGLNKEIAKNTEALDKATGIREKEHEEFKNDEKDMISSITSMKLAVSELGKHHGAAFNQESFLHAAQILSLHMKKHADVIQQATPPHERKTILALLQQAATKNPHLQEYAPQSGQILGILKGMKESFETNLASARTEEADGLAAYNALESAKSRELKAANEKAATKTEELGDTDQQLAQDKESQEDTQAALKSDTAFLSDLKDRCATMDADWAARTKVRQEEIKSVSETIGILTSDESREQFSKSLGLLQISTSHRRISKRDRVVHLLMAAGKKLGSSRLSALAISAKDDVFAEVKEQIDMLVKALTKEKEDEIAQKDYCTAELNQNEKSTFEKTDTKGDLETKIADLSNTMDALNEDIKSLKDAIYETHLQMKKAGENREAENKEFQITVADQKASQEILKKALDRLQEFYGKGAAFLQHQSDQRQVPEVGEGAPPASFGKFTKNAGSTGVMTIIENIIEESKTVEADAIKAEQDAQASYEAFIKDSNTSIDNMNNEIANKEEEKGKTEMSNVEADGDLKGTIEDLLKLGGVAKSLHETCDFTLKNFDQRQSLRDNEIEALKSSKAIFSGANFGL